jgi:hypothetical protein
MKIVYKRNGRIVSKKEFDAIPPVSDELLRGVQVRQAYQESRTGRSLAMGCHPTQAAAFNERARKMGVTGVSWDSRGHCLITSRKARRDYMKAIGLHDNDGGYGDG